MERAIQSLLPACPVTAALYDTYEYGATGGNVGPLGKLVWPYLHARIRRGELGDSARRGHWTALRTFAESYGPRAVHQLSQRDVLRWLESQHHVAPSTRRLRFGCVRLFCRWLHEEGHTERDVCAALKAPKKPRTQPRGLPADAVTAALRACPDQRARLIIVLMVQLGLRRMEVAGLDCADVDLTNRVLIVRGKGGHERVLPITAEAHDEVQAYLGMFPASHGPLIRSYRHPRRGISPIWVGDIVRYALLEAGVKQARGDGVSAHAFRHTAATDMLRAGAHVRDVQAVLGHRSLSTTEVYLPLLVGTLGAAMEGRSYGK